MIIRTSFLVVVTFVLASCSPTPDPICTELDASIDRSIQRIALSLASGDVFDKGAMQQAARYIEANNRLHVIRINLDLQVHHKCPIRKAVINPLVFEREALACIAAKDDEKSELCNLKKWKGDSK